MRNLMLKLNVSLDLRVADAAGDNGFIFPHFDDELTAYTVDEISGVGAHAMGRVTYEAMAAHWPASDAPYAAPMNEIPKVVFSRTLRDTPWGETRVLGGPLAQEVAALKAEPGGDVLVHGGAVIAQALAREGLIDEYRLIVHPVVLGEGAPAIASRLDLRLVDSRRFPAGAVALTYVPA